MTTRIKVGIRLRPFLPHELQKGYINSKILISKQTKEIFIRNDQNTKKAFKFDYIFDDVAEQQQIYEESNIDYLLNKVIEGYHSTIFVYGQTGSGKTYTMEGYEYEIGQKDNKPRPKIYQDPSKFGLIPRTVHQLFQKLKQNQQQFNVTCSFLQIYNEKIYDLLNPSSLKQSNFDQSQTFSQGLRLRWNQRDQFTVENLFVFDCKSAQEVINLFDCGIKNRVTASHRLNIASSRSHTILTLTIEVTDLSSQSSSVSKLELVDLAGSERIGFVGNEGKLTKESIDINKSLFILRQVINTLSEMHHNKNKEYLYIPYRESKLTSLLKQSIGGNSYCLMLACINPCDLFYEENVSTLNYATKATYIRNQPIKNDDPKNKIINELKMENQALRLELDKANETIQILTKVKEDNGNFRQVLSEQVEGNNIQQQQIFTNQQQLKQIKMQQNQFDYDHYSDRLIESVSMVRDLLLNNKELRENTDQALKKYETCEKELFFLQKENQELRESISKQEKTKENPLNTFEKLENKEILSTISNQENHNFHTNQHNMHRIRGKRHSPTVHSQQYLISPNNNPQSEFMTTNFGKYTFYQNEPFSGQAEQNETIPQKVANNLFYTNINIKNKNGYDKAQHRVTKFKQVNNNNNIYAHQVYDPYLEEFNVYKQIYNNRNQTNRQQSAHQAQSKQLQQKTSYSQQHQDNNLPYSYQNSQFY